MMRGLWNEANWRLDGDALLMPNGWRIPLQDIRQWRADTLEGRHDLTGCWSGWRIRQQWLIPPGCSPRRGAIAEHCVRHLAMVNDWARLDLQRRQLRLF
jgi:hypothetical protein